MCVSVHLQHSCGHISPIASETRSCNHYRLIGDWLWLQAPESQDQIDYCAAMCQIEARTINRPVDGICDRCVSDAKAAADAEEERLRKEVFDRIMAAVDKPPPHNKYKKDNSRSRDNKGGSSSQK